MGLGHAKDGERGRRRRLRAIAVVAAALTGFGSAAAVDALAEPPLEIADGFGPGDGLTRYVVAASSGDATPELLAALAAHEGVASAQRLHDGTALVATDGVSPQELRSVAGVAEVGFSTTVPVLGTASDPYYRAYGWNLENTGSNAYNQSPVKPDADIDGSDGWDAATGAGIVVAVVDTGFDSDHPDLAGALWTNPAEPCGSVDVDGNGLAGDCHGWNFTTNSPDVDNGAQGTHGASVAGVIGARKDNGVGSVGVAPEVTLMPLVIGSGEGVDVNLGAQAIRYAADHGATVVNASWGGAVTGSALTNLRSAVAYAQSKGVLVVAAAGNDSGNRDSSVLYPASLTDPNVVTVGNSTAADTVAPSSAYGATSVDLFAPGTLVATTWNDGGYRLVSGTSIAAPQVAGALALYRATMPTAPIAELKAALLADVDPVADFAGRSVTGGRLNVSRLDPAGPTTVGYVFSAMSGPVGVVSPRVRATGPAVTGSYAVTLGVGMEQGGEVWALAGQDVTLAGTTATTDDAGQVTVPLGGRTTVDGLELAPTLDLAEGRYALTVQLTVDGVPVGQTFAAPLLVGDVTTPTPGGSGTTPTTPSTPTTPGGETPGGSTPGGSTPSTPTGPGSTPTGPGTGTGTPPGGDSGSTPTTPGTGPGTGDGPGSTPGVGTPGAPGTTDPGTGSGSTPGDDGDGTTNPGTGTPGTGSGSTPGDDGDEPDTSTPGTGTPPGGGSGSTPPPTVTYPEVGPFGLTSIAPSQVSVDGGTRVTVTGTNIPTGVRVRIGGTRAAEVVTAGGTSVTFIAPAMVAGVYDVHVFGATGTTSSVLEGGLTYVAGPADGGSTPGTTPATPTTPGTTPGGTGDGSDGDGSDGSTPGTTPGGGSAGPVVTTGPGGQRLVRSVAFGRLGASFWALDCRTSCQGVLL